MRMYSLRERIEDLKKRVPTANAEAIKHEMYECEGAKVLEELEKRSEELPQALWNAWHKLWPNIDEHSIEKSRFLHEDWDPLHVIPPELHPDNVKRKREKSMPVFWDTVLRLLDANEPPSEASSNLRNQKRGRPPVIQVIQDNICDAKKIPIIPKKAAKRRELAVTVANAIRNKGESMNTGELYDTHQRQEGLWEQRDGKAKTEFKKFVKHHVDEINADFQKKEYPDWLAWDGEKLHRNY